MIKFGIMEVKIMGFLGKNSDTALKICQDEIHEIRQTIAKLSAEEKVLSDDVSTLKAEMQSLKAEINEMRTQAGAKKSLSDSVNALKAEIEELMAEIGRKKAENENNVSRRVNIPIGFPSAPDKNKDVQAGGEGLKKVYISTDFVSNPVSKDSDKKIPAVSFYPSNFIIEDGVLKKYQGSGGNVVIPDGVTSIGEDAFEYCESLTSVTIPNSVTSIGDGVFYGCVSLTSVTIPNNVTSIGGYVFTGTKWLESYPDDFVTINGILIEYKGSGGDVIIPHKVRSVNGYAFPNCENLTSITIPNSVTSIGDSAFYNCMNLTSVTITNGVKSIKSEAFYGCKNLTSVIIPDSVEEILAGAFKNCDSLTSVTIPKNCEISYGDYPSFDSSTKVIRRK
ncbi:MAG: leucine-rich repeat protein [Ruminococcus sp.]|nr:leucine-rich repeat protein [Ruminococcus sp.]